MKSNISHLPLRTWPSIEAYWKAGNIYNLRPRTMHYPSLPASEHKKDGWRDVVSPDLKENQRRGALLYDAQNDRVTYQVIDLTEEEIQSRVISQAQNSREEIIQVKIKAQVEAEFQSISDDSEALESKEAFPIWEDLEDGFEFTAGYKVQSLDALELKLFKIIQPHAKQSDWMPNITPALWSKIEVTVGMEIWSQPTGGDGKYPYLDPKTSSPYRVSHKTNTWENTHQGGLNVWEPGVFGWKKIV